MVLAAPTGKIPLGVALWAFVADVLWSGLFVALFALLAKNRTGKILRIFLASCLVLFLTVAFGFARLYQRPFSFYFVRLDSTSIWKENFISALHEIGLAHLLLAVLLTIFLVFACRAVRGLPTRLALFLGTGCALALALFYAFVPAQDSLWHNPLGEFWARKPPASPSAQLVESANLVCPPQDSPLADGLLPAVPHKRLHQHNAILYFLESTPHSVVGKSVAGIELTPHLNRWLERSLFFTRHYANFPLSINAFYSAFCSAYPLPDGAWISVALPDFPVPCLSQILKSEGYRTAVFHAGYLAYARQRRFLEKRGIDLMLDAEALKKPPFEKGLGPWGAADERALIKPLVDFARQARGPFLAMVFPFTPHHPYSTPEDFGERFSHAQVRQPALRRYFNALHFADAAFGQLMAALEKEGLLEKTILVVFGDHGEAFYEHPRNFNHPFFIYEENVHVPLAIWYPGVRPQRIARVTSHVDILPTVLELLGKAHRLSPLHCGQSMLRGGLKSVAHLQAFWREEFSGIVDDRHKYIRKESGEEELYDLANDPGEKHNLGKNYPELVALYRQQVALAFSAKRQYYKKHAGYELVRFVPASQDR